MRSSHDKSKVNQLALQAAKRGEASGVRVFRLLRMQKNLQRPVNVVAWGCHGEGFEAQSDVANSLNAHIQQTMSEDEAGTPDFALLTGDNCYSEGANSPTDPKMYDCFDHPYINNPACPLLRSFPYFPVSGNHDNNYHNPAKWKGKIPGRTTYDPEHPGDEIGIHRLMQQIAHTYVRSETMEFDSALDELLNAKLTAQEKENGYRELSLDQLVENKNYFLFLRRYYSLIVEDMQYFCIDSSNFARDFLAYKRAKQTGESVDPNTNQVAFLIAEVKKALKTGRTLMLVTHHPFISDGDRHKSDDRDIYSSQSESEALQTIFNDDGEIEDIFLDNEDEQRAFAEKNRNANVKEILQLDKNMNSDIFQCLRMLGLVRKDKLVFDAVINAHDHNLSNHCTVTTPDEYQFCQLNTGGGGGKLQNRVRFSNQANKGFFLKKKGFLEITQRTPKNPLFTFRTADRPNKGNSWKMKPYAYPNPYSKTTLCFTNKSPKAMVDCYADNAEVKRLFKIIETSINDYFAILSGTMSGHGEKGINRAHKLWAFINNANPRKTADGRAPTYGDIVNDLEKIASWKGSMKNPNKTSLISLIDKNMLAEFGETLETHAQKYPRSISQNMVKTGGSPLHHHIIPTTEQNITSTKKPVQQLF